MVMMQWHSVSTTAAICCRPHIMHVPYTGCGCSGAHAPPFPTPPRVPAVCSRVPSCVLLCPCPPRPPPSPPGFLLYSITALGIILYLVWGVTPEVATSNIFVYIGICSLAGSLSVMSCKVGEGCVFV